MFDEVPGNEQEIICPYRGGVLTRAECLDCALSRINERFDCDLVYPVLKSMYIEMGNRPDIHATDLTTCLRKAYLDKVKPVPQLVHGMLTPWTGIVAHYAVEKAVSELDPVIAEYKIDVEGILGRADLVFNDGWLVDIKTTRWMKVERLPYGSHVNQLNVYAWLLGKLGVDIKRAEIQYIDLTGPTRCRKKGCGTLFSLLVGNEDESVIGCPKCGNTFEGAHLGAYRYKVDLWSQDEAEKFVTSRRDILRNALDNKELPAPEPDWICKFCDHVSCENHPDYVEF